MAYRGPEGGGLQLLLQKAVGSRLFFGLLGACPEIGSVVDGFALPHESDFWWENLSGDWGSSQ